MKKELTKCVTIHKYLLLLTSLSNELSVHATRPGFDDQNQEDSHLKCGKGFVNKKNNKEIKFFFKNTKNI